MNVFLRWTGVTCVAVLMAAAMPIQAKKAETLYLYNWSEYMDPDIIKAFEAKYDVKVSRSFFNANPELFAKLRAGGDSQYDVIFPSSYYIERLVDSNLLMPLDKSKLPHVTNLLEEFADPDYDPGNTYSIPYQWGDTGVVYNTKKLPDLPHTWAAVFDPELNPKQPFTLNKDPQVQIGMACAYLGKGYTCDTREDWQEAAKLILETKSRSNFNGFVEGTPTLDQIARGNSAMGITFNGDYIYEKKEDPDAYKDTAFFVPEEGSELWMDTMAIPAKAPNPDLAHKFIDFILEAEIGAQLSNFNSYTSPNKAAQPYLDADLSEPPIMPTEAEMEVLEFTPALSGEDLQFLQQLWTEIQSR